MSRALKVKKIKGFEPPEIAGDYHRLVCMSGENKGFSYYLKSERVVLGRSERADIKVLDAKSSREHAELVLLNGSYVLTDLGSHNGIIVNDIKVKQHKLKENDVIVIGKTVYKYGFIKVKDLSLIKSEGLDFDDDYDDDDDEFEEDKPKKKEDNPGRTKLLLGVVVAMALFMMFSPEEEVEKKAIGTKNLKEKKKNLDFSEGNDSRRILNDTASRKVEAHIHRGLREHREGNYFRALEEFHMAKVLDPTNGRVQFYIKKSNQRLNELAKRNNERGRGQEASLKLKAAEITYCETIRILREDPGNKYYKEAEKLIENLEQRQGLISGAIKCLEK